MRAAKLVFPLILLVGAALVAISAHAYRSAYARLIADPVTGTATVVENRVETVQTPGKTTTVERQHLVQYRFTPAGGAEIDSEVSFPSGAYDGIRPGAQLEVVYRKDEPGLHVFPATGLLVAGSDTYLQSTGTYGYVFAGALTAIAFAWLLFASPRRSSRPRR